MVYLTTMSIVQITWYQIIGRLVNKEFERMWKEPVVM